MSSIIEGYNYDIFISYRQKDNKGDRWVSEFVEALKTELESTFKEEISVYFDINPHDGLLETHDVDASLKDKLKCLVFIPIISRTYCDPKSFAWEHEFKAFVDQASHDQFGLKIKLPNGNVANRTIPIQIHELHFEDKTLIEKELGGVLRAIEFIYKESGVNRPLSISDDEKLNLNKTKYRNQINKVANALDEVIHSLKEMQSIPSGRKLSADQTAYRGKEDKGIDASEPILISKKSKRWLVISISVFICVVGMFAIFIITDRGKKVENLFPGDKSIAVLQFANDSPDKENEYFCNGMMEEILNQLQKISNLNVKSRTSVEKYRNPDKDIKVIGHELGVSFIIEGSVRKIGDDLRITAQLINIKTGNHLWSQSYDGKYTTKIFEFQSSIAKKVASSLNAVITPNEEKRIDAKPTKDLLAHSLTMKGVEMNMKWWATSDSQYLRIAINFFNEALKIDPNYLDALVGKGQSYFQAGKYDSAMIYFEEVIKIDGENRDALEGFGGIYSATNKTDSAVKYFQKLVEVNPNDPYSNIYLGRELVICQNEVIKGLPFLQKAYDIGGNSLSQALLDIGNAYFFIGEYTKALKYFNQTLLLEPSFCGIDRFYSNILFIQGNYHEALNFLDSIQNFTPCQNASDVMRFYYHTLQRDFKNAEVYYNKSLNAGNGYFNEYKIYLDLHFNYLLKETGRKNEALKRINNSIKRYEADMMNDMIKFGGLSLLIDRLLLAASYAMLGENKKALEYLSQLEKFGFFEYPITLSFPGFDNLRDDPEFKAIVKRIEDQRAAVRAKVREMEQSGELHL